MMRVMNMMMLSCRKATELMERKTFGELDAFARFQSFMHTSMCDACKLYEKQSQFLENILRKQSGEPVDDKDPGKHLPDHVKSRIISELERQ
ncbi:MAG: hypothetical protein WEB30_11565 [Cyclobacteriaceae bacterium]